MNRKRQIILSVTFLCLIIAGSWGFYEYSRPHRDAGSAKTDAYISADTLYKDFTDDEAAATKIFSGKVLEVTGTVQDVSVSRKKPVVFLATGGLGNVNCLMAEDSATIFSAVKKNTVVVIKGKCSGFLMDVNLVDCVLKQQ